MSLGESVGLRNRKDGHYCEHRLEENPCLPYVGAEVDGVPKERWTGCFSGGELLKKWIKYMSFFYVYISVTASPNLGGGFLMTSTHSQTHTHSFCWEAACVCVCSCRFTVQHIWSQPLIFVHQPGMRQTIRPAKEVMQMMACESYCSSLKWKSGSDEVQSFNYLYRPETTLTIRTTNLVVSGLRINPNLPLRLPLNSFAYFHRVLFCIPVFAAVCTQQRLWLTGNCKKKLTHSRCCMVDFHTSLATGSFFFFWKAAPSSF